MAAQMNMASGLGGALGQPGLSAGALGGQPGLAGAQAAALAGLGAGALGGLPGSTGAPNLAAMPSLGQPAYGVNGMPYLGPLGALGQPAVGGLGGWSPDGSSAAQAAAMGLPVSAMPGGLAGG